MNNETDVRIVEFAPEFAISFAELNYEWIEKEYAVEEHDREILDAPFEYIIHKGGEIFFALVNGRPVGTVALIPIDDETFELAKMAVDPVYRGRSIGDKLMTACIEYSASRGKKRIVLESNTKQAPAINLYRKFRFVETELDPNSPFKRANIRMELAISHLNR